MASHATWTWILLRGERGAIRIHVACSFILTCAHGYVNYFDRISAAVNNAVMPVAFVVFVLETRVLRK